MRRKFLKQSGGIIGKTFLVVAEFFAISACVLAQPLPVMPPDGYDQGGRYPAGTVSSISYYSSVTASTRTMEVYTPPGYSISQKYPVIYAIHGISAWPDTIFAGWCVGASAISDNLIGEKKIHPMIIVAMDDNNVDTHRELFEAIIPYIESHYSTYTDADHRGIYGYSMGGGATFAEGIGHLDTFHHISPSSATPFNHPSDADMFPSGGAEAKQKMKTLLLSCGTADWDGFFPPNQATHIYCAANKIPHGWLPVDGGGHDGGVWRPAMWNFLQMADAAGICDPPRSRPAYSQIEAEDFDSQSGTVIPETCSEGGKDLGSIQNGNYVVFRNVDFGAGGASFQARVASANSGGSIEVRLDSLTGKLAGTCVVPGTGGWQAWVTKSCPISGAAGMHDLYLKFTGVSGYLFNVNWCKFGITAGQDVGTVGGAGGEAYGNGVFTITGAGADIGGTSDAFHFDYVAATNNCAMIARVGSVQNINASSKAGVMIRASLDANAPNAFVGLTPGNGAVWQYRSGAGGVTISNNTSGLSAPYWVKLERTGDAFTGYSSPDGTNWTQLGSATITMPSSSFVGLAVASHNNSSLCAATFNNVTAPGWPASNPPLSPGGLSATAGVERAILSWKSSSTATSYNVKRSTNNGGPYTVIGNIAGTNYTDRTVIGGMTYYYAVSAANLGGESLDSAQARVTPAINVPSPWLTRDVGSGDLAGGADFSNGMFTLTGSGADICSPHDAFRFVHLATNGDCTIVAHVTSIQNINPWSKAGVMIRESMADNSANAFIAVTRGNGVTWQYRSSSGGVTISNTASGLSTPYWIKLARAGNTFSGYYSADGTSWTRLGSATFAIASMAYVGLGVASHDAYTLCAATFDHVTGPGWNPPSAPAPSSLVAAAGLERVALSWTASSNAIGYNIKRATTSGGPYTTIATLGTTNYVDASVAGRTTYYYVVSALSAAGESANSALASATPAVNVPLPWSACNVGAVGQPGSAGCTNGAFTVTASGDDIWNSADAFRFVYVTTNSRSFTMVARVASLQNIDSWSKAGVMVRESLDPGAANAFVAVTPGNGVSWQYRASTGGGCNNNALTGLTAPYWVKLVRSGDTFTGYCSPNGVTWTQLGSTTISNIVTAYAGLAVTGHNNSSLCTATFDNVTVPGWPPKPLALTAIAVSSSQVSLAWNPLTNASSYNVKRSTRSGGPYTTIATGLTGTNYTDTGVSLGGGCYYVVSATVAGSELPNGPEAAVSYPELAGLIIGTPGSWNNAGDTIAKVFDSDLTTFFDATTGNGCWVGLDFGAGASNVITLINYCPRSGFESRMVGGIFQGANRADFSDGATLFTVKMQPVGNGFTSASITNAAAFRYVRYLSPNDSFGNVAELEFHGYPLQSSGSPTISIMIAEKNLVLSWPFASAGFTLQSKTNLLLGDWENVMSPVPQVFGNGWRVTLPLTNDPEAVFYRLAK